MDGGAVTRESLDAFNRRVQAILLLVAFPADAAIYLAHYLIQPCWQYVVPLVTTATMSAVWVFTFYLARRGRTLLSAALATLALEAHCVAVLLVRDRSLAIVVLTLAVLTLYVSFFSRRMLLISAGIMGGAIFLFEVLDAAGLLRLAQPSPWLHRLFEGGFLMVVVPILVYFVLEHERIGRLPFLALESSSAEQRRVLEAVAKVLPEMDGLVARLQQLGRALAAQASQQAATAAEVNSSMQALETTAEEAARAAAETRALAEEARAGSERSGAQLATVEQHFRSVVGVLQSALRRNQQLADESQRTGEILDGIRDVDDQVGMLALNASLEAARSGEAGRGFAVVAQELRRLMDTSTQRSRGTAAILEGIRREATDLAQEAGATSQSLGQHLAQLRDAADALVSISASQRGAAEQVERIASSAELQRAQTASVSQAMRDATQSAMELSGLAREIESSLEAVVRGSEELRALTGARPRGAAKAA